MMGKLFGDKGYIFSLLNVFQLEHTRHRSHVNGLINLLAAVIAYILYPHQRI